VTTYKSASAILVSSPNLDVIATVDSVMVYAFSGILFNFLYRNRGSNYITRLYRKYYNRPVNKLGI
jgi:hypothetical protein